MTSPTSPDPLAAERHRVLMKYAAQARERGDVGKPLGVEADEWLTACAAAELGDQPVDRVRLDLTPFTQVRAVLHQNGVTYGGGTGEAFRHAVALLDTALAQYGVEVPR